MLRLWRKPLNLTNSFRQLGGILRNEMIVTDKSVDKNKEFDDKLLTFIETEKLAPEFEDKKPLIDKFINCQVCIENSCQNLFPLPPNISSMKGDNKMEDYISRYYFSKNSAMLLFTTINGHLNFDPLMKKGIVDHKFVESYKIASSLKKLNEKFNMKNLFEFSSSNGDLIIDIDESKKTDAVNHLVAMTAADVIRQSVRQYPPDVDY